MPSIEYNQFTREIEVKGSESFIESNFDRIRNLLVETTRSETGDGIKRK
jgi:hypothetical protein